MIMLDCDTCKYPYQKEELDKHDGLCFSCYLDKQHVQEIEKMHKTYKCTQKYTPEQLLRIWQDHSHDLCAGFLFWEGTSEEAMSRILSYYIVRGDKVFKEIEI